MNIIESGENSLIKTVIKLKERKYRYQYGKFVLEGYRLIKDSLLGGFSDCGYIVVIAQSRYNDYCAEFKNITVVSDRLFEKISETVNSQGILAIVDIPEFKTAFSSDMCLYLDRVRDPGNLGTIVRTAAACDFHDIILDDCVDLFNPKTVRSSMSAISACGFFHSADSAQLKSSGYVILAADAKGEDIRAVSRNIKNSKVCLIIGNEANGIKDELKRSADISVALPMENGIESLNASVSAGILMYYLKYFNSSLRS